MISSERDLGPMWFLGALFGSLLSACVSIWLIRGTALSGRGLLFLHLFDFLLFVRAIPSDPHGYIRYYFPLVWPTFLFYLGFTSLLVSLAHGVSLTGFLAIFILKLSFSIVDGSSAGAFLAAIDLVACVLKLVWLHETRRTVHPEKLNVGESAGGREPPDAEHSRLLAQAEGDRRKALAILGRLAEALNVEESFNDFGELESYASRLIDRVSARDSEKADHRKGAAAMNRFGEALKVDKALTD
jgi:hypothetical protein